MKTTLGLMVASILAAGAMAAEAGSRGRTCEPVRRTPAQCYAQPVVIHSPQVRRGHGYSYSRYRPMPPPVYTTRRVWVPGHWAYAPSPCGRSNIRTWTPGSYTVVRVQSPGYSFTYIDY